MTDANTSRPETILVVDDDVRVVELLQITLTGRGYKVLTAHDGEKATQMIRREQPDLVVLDVRLPRRSGFEVLDLVRRDAILRHIPIVLISADAATESRLQGLRLGADDYLSKPFSPRELIIKIRRILDRFQDRNLLLLKTEVLEGEVKRGRETLLEMRQELAQNLNRMGAMLGQVVELNRYRSIEQILERFILTTVSNLDITQVVFLVPDARGDFHPRVHRGIEESAARGLWLHGEGPVLRLCRSAGRPVRMDELEAYPDAQEEVLRLSAAGASILSPALGRERVEAILVLGERHSNLPLGRFDYKILEILSRSIVCALENATSFESTQRSFLETTASLIANVEDRYAFIRGHSERVKDLALAMGESLGLDAAEMESLRYGALLHDLGQMEQYRDLLDRGAILSPSDRRIHRQQAAEHASRLFGPGGNGAVGEIVRHHQEYWDGTGFPDGLRELEIPLGARLIGLANAWDALVHDRPHRPAYKDDEAAEIMRERAGRQFDPGLVPVLLQVIGQGDADRTGLDRATVASGPPGEVGG